MLYCFILQYLILRFNNKLKNIFIYIITKTIFKVQINSLYKQNIKIIINTIYKMFLHLTDGLKLFYWDYLKFKNIKFLRYKRKTVVKSRKETYYSVIK